MQFCSICNRRKFKLSAAFVSRLGLLGKYSCLVVVFALIQWSEVTCVILLKRELPCFVLILAPSDHELKQHIKTHVISR
jgi:hypothetical protein